MCTRAVARDQVEPAGTGSQAAIVNGFAQERAEQPKKLNVRLLARQERTGFLDLLEERGVRLEREVRCLMEEARGEAAHVYALLPSILHLKLSRPVIQS